MRLPPRPRVIRPYAAPVPRADFIYKLGNTIEEADEAALWLEILGEAGISPAPATAPLWREADELTRIMVGSRETARANCDAARRTAAPGRSGKGDR
jgi:hypothetical protein